MGTDLNISRAQRGDREALSELVREHYARVYRFCARRIGEDLAQDAAQETFLTVQKTIKRYAGKSSFSTWVMGIAHNHCRNLSRKRRIEVPLEEWFKQDRDHANEVVNRQSLTTALGKLSDEHREIVYLHEIEGFKYAEIAEMIGIPEGTVKSRLFHAFKQLRTHLARCRYECERRPESLYRWRTQSRTR